MPARCSVWDAHRARLSWAAMRTYVQLDLGKRPDAEKQDVEISLADAQFFVARGHGFESWQALAEYTIAALPAEGDDRREAGEALLRR